MDDLTLTWRATRFPNSPPERDDGTLWDGDVPVGRVMRKVTDGDGRGTWAWSCTATGQSVPRPNRDRGQSHNREVAKVECEAAYRSIAAIPGAREAIGAHHGRVMESARLYDESRGVRQS